MHDTDDVMSGRSGGQLDRSTIQVGRVLTTDYIHGHAGALPRVCRETSGRSLAFHRRQEKKVAQVGGAAPAA